MAVTAAGSAAYAAVATSPGEAVVVTEDGNVAESENTEPAGSTESYWTPERVREANRNPAEMPNPVVP
ncbi:hypothetical protein [Streptomyces sp. NPDC086023]|uniref:hypothetical protein n=1 Tax=Streptomyces sp. NPDC086023 TaxID=3365746 RepID=UPI0037D418FB